MNSESYPEDSGRTVFPNYTWKQVVFPAPSGYDRALFWPQRRDASEPYKESSCGGDRENSRQQNLSSEECWLEPEGQDRFRYGRQD